MTINAAEVVRIFYAGNGATTTFPITFSFSEGANVFVTHIDADDVETPWVKDGSGATGYQVIGADVEANVAPDAGTQLVIYRITDVTQLSDYVENRRTPADTQEESLDKLTRMVQEHEDALERSMTIPVTSALGVSTELPIPSSLKYFRWNEDADAMEAVTAEEIAGAVLASNFVVDAFNDGVDFTAGVTTQLTLTSVPGTENNTQIYFDGIYVDKSLYTLDGSTITFASPITAGVAVVEVVFLQGAAPSVPADGSVIAVKIATDAVETAKIKDDAVTTAKILDDAVTAAKIVSGAAIKTEGVSLKCKVIEIGDWDIDSNQSVSVAHGVDKGKIRKVEALIRQDGDGDRYPLDVGVDNTDSTPQGFIAGVSATNVILYRLDGGFFDGVNFNSTSYNRGWVTVFYIE